MFRQFTMLVPRDELLELRFISKKSIVIGRGERNILHRSPHKLGDDTAPKRSLSQVVW